MIDIQSCRVNGIKPFGQEDISLLLLTTMSAMSLFGCGGKSEKESKKTDKSGTVALIVWGSEAD